MKYRLFIIEADPRTGERYLDAPRLTTSSASRWPTSSSSRCSSPIRASSATDWRPTSRSSRWPNSSTPCSHLARAKPARRLKHKRKPFIVYCTSLIVTFGVPRSAFITQHSSFRVPLSTFLTHDSALITPRSSFLIAPSSFLCLFRSLHLSLCHPTGIAPSIPVEVGVERFVVWFRDNCRI